MSARSGDGAIPSDRRDAGPVIRPGDFKRAFARFRADRIADHAASLIYYSLLSLFPALLSCAALLWVWLTDLVLLFGAELDAVVDLRRARHLPPDYDGPVLPAQEPAHS